MHTFSLGAEHEVLPGWLGSVRYLHTEGRKLSVQAQLNAGIVPPDVRVRANVVQCVGGAQPRRARHDADREPVPGAGGSPTRPIWLCGQHGHHAPANRSFPLRRRQRSSSSAASTQAISSTRAIRGAASSTTPRTSSSTASSIRAGRRTGATSRTSGRDPCSTCRTASWPVGSGSCRGCAKTLGSRGRPRRVDGERCIRLAVRTAVDTAQPGEFRRQRRRAGAARDRQYRARPTPRERDHRPSRTRPAPWSATSPTIPTHGSFRPASVRCRRPSATASAHQESTISISWCSKAFEIGGARQLQFQAHFFNLLNHPQFTAANLLAVDPGLGLNYAFVGSAGFNNIEQAGATGGSRLIQLVLKFVF